MLVEEDDADLDQYQHYAEQFDALPTDREARRSRKPAARRSKSQPIAELAEPTGLKAGFVTTVVKSFELRVKN